MVFSVLPLSRGDGWWPFGKVRHQTVIPDVHFVTSVSVLLPIYCYISTVLTCLIISMFDLIQWDVRRSQFRRVLAHTRTQTGILFQVTETSVARWMTVWLRHLKPVTSEWVFIWILLPAVSHTGGNSLELPQQECKYYGESHWDMKCSFNYNTDISRSVSQRMWRELDLSFCCSWFCVWFAVHTH